MLYGHSLIKVFHNNVDIYRVTSHHDHLCIVLLCDKWDKDLTRQ